MSLEISVQLFFNSFLFRMYCCSVDLYVVSALFHHYNQSFLAVFLCWLWILAFMHRHSFQCWRVCFVLFFTHIISPCYHLDVSPDASLLTFFSSCLLVRLLLSSISRRDLSFLQDGRLRCLYLWWDLCYRDWFPEVLWPIMKGQ